MLTVNASQKWYTAFTRPSCATTDSPDKMLSISLEELVLFVGTGNGTKLMGDKQSQGTPLCDRRQGAEILQNIDRKCLSKMVHGIHRTQVHHHGQS